MHLASLLIFLFFLVVSISADYGTVSNIKAVTIVTDPETETPQDLKFVRLSSKFALSWTYSETPLPDDKSAFQLTYKPSATGTPVIIGKTSDLTVTSLQIDFAAYSADIDAPTKKSIFSVSILDPQDATVSTVDSEPIPTMSCKWEVISEEYGPCVSIYPSPSPPFIKGVCGDGKQSKPTDCILTNGDEKDDIRFSGLQADENCTDTNAGPKPDVLDCDLGVCDNAGVCDQGLCTCAAEFAGQKCEKASNCPTCNVDNTLSCSTRQGTCTCKYGFRGDLCTEVITPNWPSSASATGPLVAFLAMTLVFFF